MLHQYNKGLGNWLNYSKIIEKIFGVFFIFGDIVKTWEKKGD